MYSVRVGVHLQFKSIKSRGYYSSITELMHSHTYTLALAHSLTQAPFIKRKRKENNNKKLFGFCLSRCV